MSRLKEILLNNGMSQKQLALGADIAQYKISNICSGKSANIQMTTAKKICNFLKCTLDEAFGDVLEIEEEI